MNTFLPLILFITISASAQVSLFHIDPRAFVENKITLADIADDLVYIPLENTFPIGSILSTKILDKSIYICAKDVGVIRFDRNGKNPIQIGRFGKGQENIQHSGLLLLMKKEEQFTFWIGAK